MDLVRDTHYYFHEYSFEHKDFLKPFNKKILKAHKDSNQQEASLPVVDIRLNIPSLENYLTPKLIKLINDNYYAGDYTINIGFLANVINEDSSEQVYHNYSMVPSNLIAILFSNIPNKVASLEINLMNAGKIEFKVFENMVYIIPNWVYHKILPQETKEDLIYLTWPYTGDIKPIHKTLASRW